MSRFDADVEAAVPAGPAPEYRDCAGRCSDGEVVSGARPAESAAAACVLVGSAALYSAGMVSNDVADIERDRRERPHRPLPSGQVGIGAATALGCGLLGFGFAAAWMAALICPGRSGDRRPLPGFCASAFCCTTVR